MEQSNVDTFWPVSDELRDCSLVTITVTATVVLDGELDCSTEREVTHRIARLLESSDAIRIDTRQVEFIDAAGIRTLVIAKREALHQGALLEMEIAPSGPVDRLLTLVGLSGW